MKTTVVITNHNYGDLLGWSIGSAHQEGVDRIVVVDDASSDESQAWYDHFGDSIEVVRTANGPVGPAATKNIGIEHSWEDTDVFGFLDADDSYRHQASVKAFLKAFTLSPKVGIAYADTEIIDEVNDGTFRVFREPFALERFVQEDIIGGNFFVTRKAMETVGKFDVEMRVGENYDLAKRVSERFVPVHIPECLTKTRLTAKGFLASVPESEWGYYRQRALENAKARPHVRA